MSEVNKSSFSMGNSILDEKKDSKNNGNDKSLSASSSSESLSSNPDLPGMGIIIDALEKSIGNLGPKPNNKTFSNEQTRDIERKNNILMKKILVHRERINRYGQTPANQKLSSSAVNRKRKDMEISHNNLILLRKIQSVKPFGMSRPK